METSVYSNRICQFPVITINPVVEISQMKMNFGPFWNIYIYIYWNKLLKERKSETNMFSRMIGLISNPMYSRNSFSNFKWLQSSQF